MPFHFTALSLKNDDLMTPMQDIIIDIQNMKSKGMLVAFVEIRKGCGTAALFLMIMMDGKNS